ncbi:TetR/AcrR family transcriptional regulator [Thioclava dalianensis]|uniref:TetR/AcrR family transcriptional regulator n=1 Tax=Thioclava dalianensis TaxID=1185766 RepID=UPI0009446A5F|nr:helix-turn-helix domain-containing protein [Thioclava dalianensis]
MGQHRSLSPRPRGRAPSAAARNKALQAAREILSGEGFGRLSIDAVAATSGVSKPTIYRNWANAGEPAMATLMADPDSQAGEGRAGRPGRIAKRPDARPCSIGCSSAICRSTFLSPTAW